MTGPSFTAIEKWKKKYKLTSEVVTIGPKRRTKIILDSNYATYYNMYAWAIILATKGNWYLCEYTCPSRQVTLREWISSHFIDDILLLEHNPEEDDLSFE